MSQNQICNQKNCSCGKQHVYIDELSNLVNTNKDKAFELFEGKKEELKKEIELLDRKRKPMAHLHCHTFHSILDGAGSIDNYIKLAKEYNHPAMAITDHGTMSGTFEFWKKCKAAGIKPIIGMEAYVNNKMGEFEEKKYEGGNSHQSIFVKNKEGFVNINKLAYLSYDKGFYHRGRIKTDWLFEHKKGLFITTSCAVSHMSKLVREGKSQEAEEYLIGLIREFGDDIAIELQFNEFDGQKIYNEWLIRMSQKYNLMPILTNDVHYAFPEEAKLQDTLIAINQKTQLGKAFKLETRNLFFASADDFHIFNKKFGFNYSEKFVNDCLDNTLKVVEKCTYDFDTVTEKFPKYEATKEVIDYFKTDNSKEIITKLSFGKLKQRIKEYKENGVVEMTPEKEQEYHKRLQYELDVIEEKNALDYFLVYWELIRDYKSKGHSVGPGRGSAGGCLLSWCLEITDIDPIRFGLYFERFMNPTRKCLTENNYILLKDGSYKKVSEITLNDSPETELGIGEFVEIVKREMEPGEKVFEIELENGLKVELTGNHIIPVIREGNRVDIRVDELLETDEMLTKEKKQSLHDLECPKCHHCFGEDEDYLTGDCPKCGEGHYYWDYSLVEDDDGSLEEYFYGYYWE